MKEFTENLKKCFSKKALPQKFEYCFLSPKKAFFSKKLKLEIKKEKDKNHLKLIFPENFKTQIPLVFCFGIFKKEGNLLVFPEIVLKKNSSLKILSFCLFPQAKKVFHQMKGKFVLEKNAELIFEEKHFHGNFSGSSLEVSYEFFCQENSRLISNFSLNQGTSGKMNLSYRIFQLSNSFSESEIKVLANHPNDQIEIEEKVFLLKEKSKTSLKLRGVAKNKGSIKLIGEIEAKAAFCFGHLDCKEVICDPDSQIISIPKLKVSHPLSSLTHEASIGKINPDQIALLQAKGLSEKEAIEFILKGFLK